MSTSVTLKAAGLNISTNQLEVPEGSLVEANNIIIKRDGVIESRRGFKLYGESFGTSSDISKQLMQYKNRIINHYSNVLEFDNGSGVFTALVGSFLEAQNGLRTKSLESNGNLYLTSSQGVKKISVLNASDLSSSTEITQAGGVKALDLSADLNIVPGNQGGFLPEDSVVAYRVVWGIKDPNGNLILGTPSEETEIYNPMLSLLLYDFVRLLGALDDIDQSGSMITDGDYVNTLKLPLTASAVELRSNLISMAEKLDEDILYANDTGVGAPLTISSAAISSSVCTITFSSGTATDYWQEGSLIFLEGFSGAGGDEINGNQTVSTVTASTVSFNTPASGSISTASSSIVSYEYREIVTNPTFNVPDSPATHNQLADIQNRLDSIILQLQVEPTSVISQTLQDTYISTLDLTTTATVNLTFPIPARAIGGNYFYQIYRSDTFTATGTDVLSDIVPDDELKLTYEAFPTAEELSNGIIEIEDVTTAEFRGANLYTNASSGEGILQANDIPPFCLDINKFKNVTFYSNTKTFHRLTLSLLGISQMVSVYSQSPSIIPKLIISNESTSNVYSFITGIAESTPITCPALASVPNGGYFTLDTPEGNFYVWYDKTGSDTDPAVSDRTGIRIRTDGLSITTASEVAARTRDVVCRNIFDFITSSSSSTVTITNYEDGYVSDATLGPGMAAAGFSIGSITQGQGEDATNKEILLSSSNSPGIAVDETARSIVRVINRNSSENVYAYYISTISGVPGKFLLEARVLNDLPFYVVGNNSYIGNSFTPNISPTLQVQPGAVGTSITVANPTVITTSTNHGLSTGTEVLIVGSNTTNSIDGIHAITSTAVNKFSIPVNVTVSESVSSNTIGIIPISSAQVSENEEKPNRIYYSKLQQPEAVPIVNYMDVGAEDKAILRILPLRDSLFVFKEDGLYRISGEIIPFNLALFDGSCELIAADSPGLINNQIFCWTTQGISTVSETGVLTASRPIDTVILKLASSDYTNFPTATWGIGYSSDNSYIVNTLTKTDDDIATIAYRYSTLTNTWTTYDKSNTCGLVFSGDGKLYLGAGDINYIEQERKSFNRTDYADREISSTLSSGNYNDGNIILPTISGIAVGDVVTQTQTLTIYQFNNILRKLDNDSTTEQDYLSTLEITSAGIMLNDSLDSLITKVSTDSVRLAQAGAFSSGTYTALLPSGSSFSALQTTYDTFIGLLNTDPGISSSNYQEILNTTLQEAVILAIDIPTKTLTLSPTLPFVVGPLVIYKAIECNYTYSPNTFGDPVGLKHIREATLMFSNLAFTNATLSFSTDLLPAFIDIDFDGDSNGIFGHQAFGSGFFGGASNSAPFRTYIPRNCQRCRYLNVRFTHKVAREEFSIFGLSLTGEVGQSTRGYR